MGPGVYNVYLFTHLHTTHNIHVNTNLASMYEMYNTFCHVLMKSSRTHYVMMQIPNSSRPRRRSTF